MGADLYLKRSIEEVIIEATRYFSVISVMGPRQSGKSTLLKHLFLDSKRHSMKDVNAQEFAENDPVAFLNQHQDGMFIDEVQKIPALLEYIQGIVDDHPDSNQNETDILLKEAGEITAIEVKASMTYHSSFEHHIKRIGEWIATPVVKRAVVYAGDFENTAAEIQLLNFCHLHSLICTQ